MVMIVQVLDKYMIIGYLDPWGLVVIVMIVILVMIVRIVIKIIERIVV